MTRVFISYRRLDSISIAGRIYDRLVREFGDENIFKDVDKIPLGSDFRTVIETEIHQADIMLVIIGQRWLNIKTNWLGKRRLDNPNDPVRIEIEAGLKRDPNVLVVPLLVNGAGMPSVSDLPTTIRNLSYKNAAVIRDDPDFNRDINRLIKALNTWLANPRVIHDTKQFISPTPRDQIPIHKPAKRTSPKIILGILLSFFLLVIINALRLSLSNEPTLDLAGTAYARLTETSIARNSIPFTNTPNIEASVNALMTQFVTGTTIAGTLTATNYTFTPSLTNTPTPSATSPASILTASSLFSNQTQTTIELHSTNTKLLTETPSFTPTPTILPATPTSTPNIEASQTANAIMLVTAQQDAAATLAVQATRDTIVTLAAQTTQDAAATLAAQITRDAQKQAQAVVIPTSINLRNGPGKNYSVAGIGTKDEIFPIVAVNSKVGDIWYLVQINPDKYAWVSAAVVTVDSNLDQLLTAVTIPAPPPTLKVEITPSLTTPLNNGRILCNRGAPSYLNVGSKGIVTANSNTTHIYSSLSPLTEYGFFQFGTKFKVSEGPICYTPSADQVWTMWKVNDMNDSIIGFIIECERRYIEGTPYDYYNASPS